MKGALKRSPAIIIHISVCLCIWVCVHQGVIVVSVVAVCTLQSPWLSQKWVISMPYVELHGIMKWFLSAEFHWSQYTNTAALYALWEQQAGVISNNRMTGFNTSAPHWLPLTPQLPHSTTPRATGDTIPSMSANVQYICAQKCVSVHALCLCGRGLALWF